MRHAPRIVIRLCTLAEGERDRERAEWLWQAAEAIEDDDSDAFEKLMTNEERRIPKESWHEPRD